MSKKAYEYAIYKGDNFITIGTLKEIAKYLGITYGVIRTYKSKKIIYDFVKLDEEFKDEKNLFIRNI